MTEMNKFFYKATSLALKIFLPKNSILIDKFKLLSGIQFTSDAISKYKARRVKRLSKLLLFLILIFAISVIYDIIINFGIGNTTPDTIYNDIRRNKNINVNVKIHAPDENSFNIQEKINIRKKKYSSTDSKKAFDDLEQRLPEIILKGNESFKSITSPINLISYDPDTGISIKWSSYPKNKIYEDGSINIFNVKNGDKVKLIGNMYLFEYNRKINTTLTLKPNITHNAVRAALEKYISNMEREYSAGKINSIVLPNKIGFYNLEWMPHKKNISLYIFAIGIVIFSLTIIHEKNIPIKEIRIMRDEITVEIPTFINKMILLLNAGLIATEALKKITEDYNSQPTRKNLLYDAFSVALDKSKETNMEMIHILNIYAKNSGVKELRSIITIIHENINTGTTLCEKLEKEAELLAISYRINIEKKIKVSEVKLTFPMAIQLLVIVLITIAPNMIWK